MLPETVLADGKQPHSTLQISPTSTVPPLRPGTALPTPLLDSHGKATSLGSALLGCQWLLSDGAASLLSRTLEVLPQERDAPQASDAT